MYICTRIADNSVGADFPTPTVHRSAQTVTSFWVTWFLAVFGLKLWNSKTAGLGGKKLWFWRQRIKYSPIICPVYRIRWDWQTVPPMTDAGKQEQETSQVPYLIFPCSSILVWNNNHCGLPFCSPFQSSYYIAGFLRIHEGRHQEQLSWKSVTSWFTNILESSNWSDASAISLTSPCWDSLQIKLKCVTVYLHFNS